MPITQNVYLCSKCGSRFDTYIDARTCEDSPFEFAFKPGDEITFENEEDNLGIRWSYSTESGKVLGCYLNSATVRATGQIIHVPMYIVSIRDRAEAIVTMDDDGGYVSPGEHKYKPGYAKQLVQNARLIGITGYLCDADL